MSKKLVFLLVVLALMMAGAFIIGCGSDDDPPIRFVIIGEPYVVGVSTPDPMPEFLQTVDATDGDYELFPGQANIWDLTNDFSIDDGGNDQFDNALQLYVNSTGAPSTYTVFPSQVYADLTFYTPVLGSSDGVIAAAVSNGNDLYTDYSISGTYSAYLAPISGAKLQQTLNLSSASGAIGLSWSDDPQLGTDNWTSPISYKVLVLNSSTGEEMEELYSTTTDVTAATRIANLTAYSGETIILSFELTVCPEDWSDKYVVIDDVTVTDVAVTEFVTNGDFETGNLTGWTVPAPQVVHNVTSATETVGDVDITRSFFTKPNKLWGRMVDEFANTGVSNVSLTVRYDSNLGSDTYGIIYNTTGAGGKAITTWDGTTGTGDDRDIGFVFGDIDDLDYTSDDGMDNGNGSDDIYHYFDITVPAGGSVVIVNFIVMTGDDTGDAAEADSNNILTKATKVDNENLNILNNFWTNSEFRDGMTLGQIANIVNF